MNSSSNKENYKQLLILRDYLNSFYRENLKDTDHIKNPSHKVLYEAILKIEEEMKLIEGNNEC